MEASTFLSRRSEVLGERRIRRTDLLVNEWYVERNGRII